MVVRNYLEAILMASFKGYEKNKTPFDEDDCELQGRQHDWEPLEDGTFVCTRCDAKKNDNAEIR